MLEVISFLFGNVAGAMGIQFFLEKQIFEKFCLLLWHAALHQHSDLTFLLENFSLDETKDKVSHQKKELVKTENFKLNFDIEIPKIRDNEYQMNAKLNSFKIELNELENQEILIKESKVKLFKAIERLNEDKNREEKNKAILRNKYKVLKEKD